MAFISSADSQPVGNILASYLADVLLCPQRTCIHVRTSEIRVLVEKVYAEIIPSRTEVHGTKIYTIVRICVMLATPKLGMNLA